MQSRFFLGLCAIVLFAAVATAAPAEEVDMDGVLVEVDEDIDRGQKTKIALELLKKAFAKVNVDCLYEAIEECGFNIFHPKRLYKCGKAYFDKNKDRCIN